MRRGRPQVLSVCLLSVLALAGCTRSVGLFSGETDAASGRCGDGILNAGEACDDGPNNSDTMPDSCRSNCTLARCGDLIRDTGETCEGAVTIDTCETMGSGYGPLGCSADCTFDTSQCVSVCGDGLLHDGEQCDDGNLASHDGCSSGCTEEIPTWVEIITSVNPFPRRDHSMAFDSARGVTVLAGGVSFFDTWEYDGTAWIEVPLVTIPTIFGGPMVYDEARGVMVMVGRHPESSKTWEFDGTDWVEVLLADSPAGRSGMSLAYDPARQVAVLHGGRNTLMDPWILYEDTWEYDGQEWVEVTEANPFHRHFCGSTYDPQRGVVVLAGNRGWPTGYTWQFDGLAWTTLWTATEPTAEAHTQLVFNPSRGRVTLFGGSYFFDQWDFFVAETWEFDGVDWSNVTPSPSPPERIGHAMAYDSWRRRVVLFGGGIYQNADNDTWEFHWTSSWPDEVCGNGADDDGDGVVDCDDFDCFQRPGC